MQASRLHAGGDKGLQHTFCRSSSIGSIDLSFRPPACRCGHSEFEHPRETIVSLYFRTFDALNQWESFDVEHQQYGSGEATPCKSKAIYAYRLPTMSSPLHIVIMVLSLLRPPQHPLLHASENVSQSVKGVASQALAYAAVITIWHGTAPNVHTASKLPCDSRWFPFPICAIRELCGE